MSGSYIGIGGGGSGGGSAFYIDPVANFAALPAGVPTGTIGLTLDSGIVYYYDGASWDPIDTELASVAVTDTNSIDHTVTGGVLSSDLRLSSDAATAGYFKATATIKGGGSPGLHVEAQEASGSQTGFLKSADWTTFNNKEPAITAATTGDYYRGDKSFQPLNIEALTAFTDGSSAGAGKINQILTAAQSPNTATGIAASGVWGNVTSLSLTAGRWLLQGVAGLSESGAVLTDFIAVGISDSASGLGMDEFSVTQINALISSTADAVVSTPLIPISIGSTTTYYLNTKFNYSSGTPQHRGRIRAIRIG